MSLRQAINAKCRECIYDPIGGAGHWRQQVAACTSHGCPLFAVRPMPRYRASGVGVDRVLAVEESAETATEAA